MLCTCIGTIVFAFNLVLWTLPVWVLVRINFCIAACCPSYLPRVHTTTKVGCSWAWWLATRLSCCFLHLRVNGQREMNESLERGAGKPRVLIMNHLSFMDALVIMTVLGGRAAREIKSLAAAHLFNMPFLGGIGYGAGHFKVPFKNNETKPADNAVTSQGSVADFSVDKDAVAKVMDDFEDWLKTGHIGAWFPEGRMNPDPATLQTFRAGGFKPTTRVDCEIWCVAYGGFEVFWNRKALVGGAPANCRCDCFKLCDSSFDLIKELAKGEEVDEKQKCLLIANYAQAKFQAKVDEFRADGWTSTLPSRNKEGGDVALAQAAS